MLPRCRRLWRGLVVRDPNLTRSVFPDGMNTSRIVPVDAKRTRLVYNLFFRDCSPGHRPEIERTIAANCAIVREDFGLCEAAQGNLDSGTCDRGPLSRRSGRVRSAGWASSQANRPAAFAPASGPVIRAAKRRFFPWQACARLTNVALNGETERPSRLARR